MNSKPDWNNAPEWAKFLAMDNDGRWVWYQEQPFVGTAGDGQWKCTGKYAFDEDVKPSWEETLEARPS